MPIFKKPTIQDLIDRGKAKARSVQSLGIQIPSLIGNQGGQGPQNDALVYTKIELIDEGTLPDGSSIPSNITYCLPPPIQIIDLHSANWEGVAFGEKIKRLSDVRSGNSPILGALDSVREFIEKFGKDLFEELKGAVGAGPGANVAASEKLLRARIIGGEDAYNLYSVGTRTAINPNIELAFRGANLRNMQLNFRLVPLNTQNATDIQKFIDKMRLMMYAASDSVWATGYPARFSVQVKTKGSGGGPWQNKILFSLGDASNPNTANTRSSCVLTDFQISYGEGGIYSGHYDGSPGFVDLNLTFQEALLSTRETIRQEYKITGI